MRDRKFGVEIEFDSNGVGNAAIGDEMVSAGFYDWVGEKITRYTYYDENPTHYYDDIGSDGSELEIRSPILQGASGFKSLKKVIDLLNGLGCRTTNLDGLHVHHDAPEFVDNKPMIIKLLKSWEANQEHVSKFVSRNRLGRGACPQITSDSIYMFENQTRNNLRYQIENTLFRANLNCRSLYEHGTIELRYHEGTLDWDNMESWIRFGQSFINGVVNRKNPIVKAETPVVLLNRLKTSKKAHVNLVQKAISNGYSIFDLGVANVHA
jgi:hypothetical protein